ncbi:Sensor histidine kinase [Vibrio nigripulchritudo ATCC 27043]|uniref:ATP-binding protein n=1 Tax=Vibrio nigripulchritudo TaxID=28173 RepID=UPI00021C298F|nr:DUF3404 domain-containing protein [Vibrio nigripulchritudo]EGU61569.1 Sensor histidine kinase [Vibrio nigripulchritudo ATCC 27043]
MPYRHLIFTAALCLSTSSWAEGIQDKWQNFYQQAWQNASLVVSQQSLNHYPNSLLLEEAQYPDFDAFSWQELALVSTVRKRCQPADSDNPVIADAIEFELALCRGTILDVEWFQSHTLLHPAGGSFADRYPELYPHSKTELTPFFTLANPDHPLFDVLAPLSQSGREALLSGYRAWQEGDTLWLNSEQGWKTVSSVVWQPIASQLNLTLETKSNQCALRYSNLCINDSPSVYQSAIKVVAIGALIILSLLMLRSGYIIRQQNREKRFVMQLLTHELRTPITSLGLTVEMFRDDYDNLSQHVQSAVWRLMSDFQRLSQLTENSRAYLSQETASSTQSASVEEWLSHICEKHDVPFQLEQDTELTLPFYWLSICLDNLIKNAKQHGKGKVQVLAQIKSTLIIEVRDEGTFPSPIQSLFATFKYRKTKENMGIGLSIVEQLMKKHGGTLTILRRPTRCILEIPYEHPTAD